MDKLSKAIQVLEDQINYSVRNMDEVSVELDFESADIILELLKEFEEHEEILKTLGYHWTGKGETLALCSKGHKCP